MLKKLPIEILLEIAKLSSKSDIFACCLVNKHWYESLYKLLFKRITLTPEIVKRSRYHSDFTQYIDTLIVPFPNSMLFLQKCTQLKSLTLLCSITDDDMWIITSNLSNLLNLEILVDHLTDDALGELSKLHLKHLKFNILNPFSEKGIYSLVDRFNQQLCSFGMVMKRDIFHTIELDVALQCFIDSQPIQRVEFDYPVDIRVVLKNCRGLTHLTLSNSKLGDIIQQNPLLTHLSLDHVDFDLSSLVNHDIRKLEVVGCGTVDEILKLASRYNKLEIISFLPSTRMAMSVPTIASTQVSQFLTCCPLLRKIQIPISNDEILLELTSCKWLCDLSILDGANITNDAFMSFFPTCWLLKLNLSCCNNIDDTAIQCLVKHSPRLEELRLPAQAPNVTIKSLEYLANLSQLENISNLRADLASLKTFLLATKRLQRVHLLSNEVYRNIIPKHLLQKLQKKHNLLELSY